MNARRAIATIVLTLLALVAAACGGSGSSSATGSSSGGAEQAPAGAPAFISVNTDLSSDQWKAIDKLLQKFPGRQKLISDLRRSFETDAGVNWETDVKPALGPELDVVVLDFANGGSAVALTQPKDENKFNALVKKANAKDPQDQVVTEKVGDWTVISGKQAYIDTYKQQMSGDKLSGDATFKAATGKLSDDAVAKVYVNGAKAQQAIQQQANAGGQVGKFDWAVAELVAQDEGMKLDGTFKGEAIKGVKQPAAYAPKLLAEVPSGALMVLDFKGGNQNLDALNGQGMQQLQGFLQMAKSITPIFENETVLYVAPGTPFPEVTLVAQPKNPEQSVTALSQLATQLGVFAGGVQPKQVQVGGKNVMELNFGQFAVDYGVVDGKLVVTSSRRAITGGSGGSLTDDSVFKDAKSVAGMPDQVSSMVYVNLKDGIPVIESFAQVAGSTVPPDVSENVRPLQSFVAYSTGDGSETSFTAFLSIK